MEIDGELRRYFTHTHFNIQVENAKSDILEQRQMLAESDTHFAYISATTGYGPGDKRRKPLQLSSMTYILDESDILDDLKIINKNKAFSVTTRTLSDVITNS
jgi:hypothetical protein